MAICTKSGQNVWSRKWSRVKLFANVYFWFYQYKGKPNIVECKHPLISVHLFKKSFPETLSSTDVIPYEFQSFNRQIYLRSLTSCLVCHLRHLVWRLYSCNLLKVTIDHSGLAHTSKESSAAGEFHNNLWYYTPLYSMTH